MGEKKKKAVTTTVTQGSKRANYYKLQAMRTEKNKLRWMRRHLRAHPEDQQSIQRYEMLGGVVKEIGLNAAGRHHQMRRIQLAKRGPKPRKAPPQEAPAP